MQLPIEVERVKNARGRIMVHRATLAGFTGEGPTPKDAVLDLSSAIAAHDHPIFRCSLDGAIWIAYDLGGVWWYSICRPDDVGTGWVSAGGCGNWRDKGACKAAMERHLADYNAGLLAPGWPCAELPACAFTGATDAGVDLVE